MGATDKVNGVQLFHAALEMQPPAHLAQLLGYILRIARLGPVQDQGGPVRGGRHQGGSAARPTPGRKNGAMVQNAQRGRMRCYGDKVAGAGAE